MVLYEGEKIATNLWYTYQVSTYAEQEVQSCGRYDGQLEYAGGEGGREGISTSLSSE
jgi:hypothetical protein